MRALAVLALLALAAGAWYLLDTGLAPGRATDEGAVRPTAVRPGPRAPSPEGVPRALVPTPRAEPVPEPAPADGPPPDGVEDGRAPAVRDLSQRFAGWSRQRMVEHLRDIELRLNSDQDIAFKRRFEAGQFDIYPVDLEAQGQEAWDALAIRPPEGEVGRGRLRFGDPDAAGKRPAQYQFAVLPRPSHAALYERLDERDWLRAHLSNAGSAPGDGGG